MKFSESLKYNAVPEWKQNYLNYSGMKTLIYALQKKKLGHEVDEELDDILEELDLELELGINDIILENSSNLGSRVSTENVGETLEADLRAHNESHSKFNMKALKNKFQKNNNHSSIDDELTNAAGLDEIEQTFELDDLKKANNTVKVRSEGVENVLSTVDTSSPEYSQNKISNKFKNVFAKKSKNQDLESGIETISTNSDINKITIYCEDVFLKRLALELEKIDTFFVRKQNEFYGRFSALMNDIEKVKQRSYSQSMGGPKVVRTLSNQTILRSDSVHTNAAASTAFAMNGIIEENPFSDDDDEEEDEEDEANNSLSGVHSNKEYSALLSYDDFNIKTQKKAILKKALINIYVDLSQLRSFSELNKIGFTKIVKKFDKVIDDNLKEEYISNHKFFVMNDCYIYKEETVDSMDDKLNIIIDCFAKITDNVNFDNAKQELRSYLRDYIVWERSTVWKDMLGLEYSTKYNLSSKNDKYIKSDELDKLEKTENILQLEWKRVALMKGVHVKIPAFLCTLQALKVTLIVALFIVLLCIKTFNDHVQKRCMAMLALVALFWATEAIPLFVTALLVPLLSVVLLVYKNTDGTVMSAADASSKVLAAMWSSTIMVLFAGFTLSAALTKYNVAKVLASYLLSAAGQKPRNVLLMVMGVVFFLSMWISNVASPVLTYSLCQPIFRTLSADAPFAKALVLGVALAADFGGMASPISSPQNVFSMTYLKPYGVGWGQFFAVALPCGLICLILVWGEMCLTFNINKHRIQKFKPIKTKFTVKQWFVAGVTVATILLWCLLTKMPGFGSSGIISVIPIVLFFGSGMLNGQDLAAFPWTIILLAMGGISLGSAVESSGLLNTIGTALQKRIEDFSELSILAIFGIIMLVFGTFVSHTVAAIIIVPLVQEVGSKLTSSKAAPILIFGCCLLSSCGMALPSSGFPNITAIGKVDDKGKNYLTVNHFLTRGIPSTFMGYIVIITVGFGIMNSIFTNVPYVSEI